MLLPAGVESQLRCALSCDFRLRQARQGRETETSAAVRPRRPLALLCTALRLCASPSAALCSDTRPHQPNTRALAVCCNGPVQPPAHAPCPAIKYQAGITPRWPRRSSAHSSAALPPSLSSSTSKRG